MARLKLVSRIEKIIKAAISRDNSQLNRNLERQLLLLGQRQCALNSTLDHISDLGSVELAVSSQWGEDGIIDWLVSKLPTIPRTFVEFGVENYRESNTRFLLQKRNWRGLVIDGSAENIADIRSQSLSWRHELNSKCAFITRENINELIQEGGFEGEVGLLSIDIDGNDYWVWRALECISPAVVVIEYNAVLGDLHQITVPYSPDFDRKKANHTFLYFGASLPALIALGRQKGYTFVGSTTAGLNAFFIRDDVAPFITSCLEGMYGYPSLFRESRGLDGELLLAKVSSRSELIRDCPLVVTIDEKNTSIGALNEIYSPQWKRLERRSF
ncbi:MAG: hypothetical protein FJ184_05195 [Gammaproteobacteria bacterium]|nr:hypothetical protein [Gammaproteobacteria bacterium]